MKLHCLIFGSCLKRGQHASVSFGWTPQKNYKSYSASWCVPLATQTTPKRGIRPWPWPSVDDSDVSKPKTAWWDFLLASQAKPKGTNSATDYEGSNHLEWGAGYFKTFSRDGGVN